MTRSQRSEYQRDGRGVTTRPAARPGVAGQPWQMGALPRPRLRRLRRCACARWCCWGSCWQPAEAIPPSPPTAAAYAPTAAAPSASPSVPLPSEPSPSERVIPGLALPQPGPAFDAATLLDAMRTSRRPGGVPDQLRDRPDRCDPRRDALDLRRRTVGDHGHRRLMWHADLLARGCGNPPGPLGEDLWVFEIVPGTGSVTVASADLSSLPIEIVDPLDDLARMLFRPGRLDGLVCSPPRARSGVRRGLGLSCAGCPRHPAGSSS